MQLAWLYWDPNPIAFTIPYFNHPIPWYAIFFVSGFIAGFWIVVPILKQKFIEMAPESAAQAGAQSISYIDGLTWCIIIGTLVGARLGHVFFYDWPRYQANPIEIIKTWEGGLASHGGAVGVLIAIYLYYRYRKKQHPAMSFINLLDMLSVPIAFVAVCIRVGNFMNQEIYGTPTEQPWGVIFGHPAGMPFAGIPFHPVQLYEAGAYLLTFVVLLGLWLKKGTSLRPGILFGLFLTMIFGLRFILEFWKAHQSTMIDESFLQTGQYLSIPFILAGVAFLFYRPRQKPTKNAEE